MKVPLKEAVRLEILPRNPADKVEALAEDTRYRGILTTIELKELFSLGWKGKRGKYASMLAAVNALLGEEVRKERNITFHSFRHFFNSTIRGSVSDDILRLQTGHLSEKMTDHYGHMTDERGELLRMAIRNKILPLVQAEGE